MGTAEEQTKDELREAVPWLALLLRQAHNPQDCWQALRVPIRLRASESFRVGAELMSSFLQF